MYTMDQKHQSRQISRRGFLKKASLGVAGAFAFITVGKLLSTKAAQPVRAEDLPEDSIFRPASKPQARA